MKYILDYNNYDQEMNEGLKNWVATFLMLANIGLVPSQINTASAKEKQEFVERQPQDKIDAALLVKYMSDNKLSDIPSSYSQFIKANPNVKTPLDTIRKYVNRSGKQVLYDKKYLSHDYSKVDINNFTPDNWLTDMADIIPDQNEPKINNWISDYEKKTSVEIGIITVKNLNDLPIEDYAQEQFGRLGIGKKYANDGILLVFSMEDRKWRIHTGYGVESDLPDIICQRIGEYAIIPHFKQGDYEGGIIEALEKIRESIGDGSYELKKKADQEEKTHNEMALKEGFAQVFGALAFAALIGGIIGTIVYLIRKRRLEKADREDLLNKIDKTIKDFNQLVISLPDSIDTTSQELVKSFGDVKRIIKNVSLSDISNKKLKKEELNKIYYANSDIYNLLMDASKKFRQKYSEVERSKTEIKSISNLKLNAYGYIELAISSAMEIKKLGYEPGDIPTKSQIDKLDELVNRINDAVSIDFDKASVLFGSYKQQLSSITGKSGGIKTKLNDIKISIDKVVNWENSISRTLGEFKRKANSGEKSKVEKMIEEFKSKISNTKDYVSLESDLDNLISVMKRAISRYDDEDRKKKRAKEDNERRSSYSSSSYSSSSYSSDSSSSFGGFGGGDSGGGGASGSF